MESEEEQVDEDNARNPKTSLKNVIKVMMQLDNRKKPFGQHDISKKFGHKPPGNHWNEVLEVAEKKLRYMGYNVHIDGEGPHKKYFLTSKVYPLKEYVNYATKQEMSDRILLTFVLAYIFLKSGSVFHTELLNHLKKLSIYESPKDIHPYFGDVHEKVLVQFVNQLYLTVTYPNPDEMLVSWGQRAEIEMNKEELLKFLCEYGFQGKISPKSFTFQYKSAEEQKHQQALVEESHEEQSEDREYDEDQGNEGQCVKKQCMDRQYDGEQRGDVESEEGESDEDQGQCVKKQCMDRHWDRKQRDEVEFDVGQDNEEQRDEGESEEEESDEEESEEKESEEGESEEKESEEGESDEEESAEEESDEEESDEEESDEEESDEEESDEEESDEEESDEEESDEKESEEGESEEGESDKEESDEEESEEGESEEKESDEEECVEME